MLWFLSELMETRHLIIFSPFIPIGLLRFYCQVMVYSEVTCNQCFDFLEVFIFSILFFLFCFVNVWSESFHFHASVSAILLFTVNQL